MKHASCQINLLVCLVSFLHVPIITALSQHGSDSSYDYNAILQNAHQSDCARCPIPILISPESPLRSCKLQKFNQLSRPTTASHLVLKMCSCKMKKPDDDEELVVPNRPRRQVCSQSSSGHNLYTLPARVEPLGAIQCIHVHEQPNCAEVSRRTESSLSKPSCRARLALQFTNGISHLGQDS